MIWTNTDNAVVAAGLAVQSQWLGPWDLTGNGGLGFAQVSNYQMEELYNLAGENQLLPSVAVDAMDARISRVENEYNTWCNRIGNCNPTDRLIIAGLVQNGSEFENGLVSDINDNFLFDNNTVNWPGFFDSRGGNPSASYAKVRQDITRLKYGTEFMLKLFMQDLEVFLDVGYKLPAQYQGADFDYIHALFK